MCTGVVFLLLVGLGWPVWRMWRGDHPDAEQ